MRRLFLVRPGSSHFNFDKLFVSHEMSYFRYGCRHRKRGRRHFKMAPSYERGIYERMPPFYRKTRSHEIEKVSVYQYGDLLLSKRKQSTLSLEYFCIIKAIHYDVYSICFNYYAIETQIKDK